MSKPNTKSAKEKLKSFLETLVVFWIYESTTIFALTALVAIPIVLIITKLMGVAKFTGFFILLWVVLAIIFIPLIVIFGMAASHNTKARTTTHLKRKKQK